MYIMSIFNNVIKNEFVTQKELKLAISKITTLNSLTVQQNAIFQNQVNVSGTVTADDFRVANFANYAQGASIVSTVIMDAPKGEITLSTTGTINSGYGAFFILENDYVRSDSVVIVGASANSGGGRIQDCVIHAMNYVNGGCVIFIKYYGSVATDLNGTKIRFVVL